MPPDPTNTIIKRKASGLSLLGKILLMVVYRTLLLALVFFLGHVAYGIHWSLAVLTGILSFAAIMKFWSPSDVLDGSEIGFRKK